ncbi:MAG: class IV adenylate cyclase [Promethearchaeota archaeon]|nr:MAG: class IV adenylate cyclase [Candidatus Lokiarchaeota archaeon]
MIEVEIKAKVLDPEELVKKFKNQEGKYKISFIHEDTYFNMPEGLRDFKKTDEALRIRKSIEYNKNSDSSKQNINYFLTYKGKKLDKTTKTRNELETKLENGDSVKEIFNTLGFRKIFTVKKKRDLYEFNFKGYIIEALIDFIPILKEHFIEVEIMSESNDRLEESKNILFEFLNLFEIKKEESIRKSYLELIADRFRRKLIR